MQSDNEKFKLIISKNKVAHFLFIFWRKVKNGLFDYLKYVGIVFCKLNEYSKKWTLLTILLAGLAIYVPVNIYQSEYKNNKAEQDIAAKEIKNNEIKSLNQINVTNLLGVKSRLDDLENEKNIMTIADSKGTIYEIKLVQFWNDFWTDVYSSNFYIINKNHGYNDHIIKHYNNVVVELEAVNSINGYINELLSQADINDANSVNKFFHVAILRETEKKQLLKAYKSLIPIINSTYDEFSNILDDEGVSLIKDIESNNPEWLKELNN